MTSYVVNVSIVWLMLILLYYTVLRSTTFFSVNRSYLMVSLLIGLSMPKLIDFYQSFGFQQASSLISAYITLPEMVTRPVTKINYLHEGLFYLYLFGCLISMAKFSNGLLKIWRLYANGIKVLDDKYTLVHTGQRHLPFSFMRYIFLGQNEDKSKLWPAVLNHEMVHIRQMHSIDTVLVELLHCAFWFNPILIFYKKALRENHEFLADDKATQSYSKENYIHLLMQQYLYPTNVAFTHSFFQSQFKNRIKMLYTKKSGSNNLLRYLLAIPLLMASVMVLSSYKQHHVTSINQNLFQVISDTIPAKKQALKKADVRKAEKMKAIPPTKIQSPPPPPPLPKQDEMIFQTVDEMPRFPGCEEGQTKEEKIACSNQKLMEYLFANLRYPEEARKNNIEGKCIVRFVINTKGYLENIELIKNPGGGTGEETVRLVTSMNQMPERWVPGMNQGKKVNVSYTLPVFFKLTDDKK